MVNRNGKDAQFTAAPVADALEVVPDNRYTSVKNELTNPLITLFCRVLCIYWEAFIIRKGRRPVVLRANTTQGGILMDPKVTQKLEEDVSFVRQAVEQREEDQYRTLGITVLWAVIIAVGYTLNDFAAEYSPLFWAIAPTGWFLGQLRPRCLGGKKTGSPQAGAGEETCSALGHHLFRRSCGDFHRLLPPVRRRGHRAALRPHLRCGVLSRRAALGPAHPLAGGPAHLRGGCDRPHPALPLDHSRVGHCRRPSGQRPMDETKG